MKFDNDVVPICVQANKEMCTPFTAERESTTASQLRRAGSDPPVTTPIPYYLQIHPESCRSPSTSA